MTLADQLIELVTFFILELAVILRGALRDFLLDLANML